jgi:hypothetical protein
MDLVARNTVHLNRLYTYLQLAETSFPLDKGASIGEKCTYALSTAVTCVG